MTDDALFPTSPTLLGRLSQEAWGRFVAHVAAGCVLFALGVAGVGLQGWHAAKRPRGEDKG
jgi:hypothetical protein